MEEDTVQDSSVLEGKTIVVSGNFSVSRDEIKELITRNGGKNSSSVSGKTSYLLAGEKPGPEKIKKAQNLGVEIIDEARFRAMLAAAGVRHEPGDSGQERENLPAQAEKTPEQPTLF